MEKKVYHLGSKNIRFGCYGEASLTDSGALKQPFYRGTAEWFKLTYSEHALDFHMMIGGKDDGQDDPFVFGHDGYNTLGEELDLESNTEITVDASQFKKTCEFGDVEVGCGELKVTQTFTDQAG